MLITFAKSLDPDQDQQSVSSDLDLTTVSHSGCVPERNFQKKLIFGIKISRLQKKKQCEKLTIHASTTVMKTLFLAK